MNPEQKLYVVLCALFVTALVVADTIGAKLFETPAMVIPLLGWTVPALTFSSGIIPFPVTFLLTDLINEFYGKSGAKFITYVGLAMALFVFGVYFLVRYIPATADSPISTQVFNTVFGLSARMFVASVLAYMTGQLLDIYVFHLLRQWSKGKMLWLRATGSTVVSQLMDSLAVTLIAFYGILPWERIVHIGLNNYGIKFVVAVLLTPLCYVGHAIIVKYLHQHQAETVQK